MASVRAVVIAPATHAYLEQETRKDPLVSKVLEGLKYRLAREPGNVGYPVPGFRPPKYVVRKSFRFPIPRVLRLIYSYTEAQVLIEVAEVLDNPDMDRG